MAYDKEQGDIRKEVAYATSPARANKGGAGGSISAGTSIIITLFTSAMIAGR